MELRKRKAPVEPKDAPVAKKKVTTKTSAPKVRASKAKAKEVSEVPPVAPAAPAAPTEPTEPIEPVAPVAPVASRQIPTVGAIIDFEQYQDEVQLEDGTTTSLKALVESSKNGVVLFTYPKASTPGCK